MLRRLELIGFKSFADKTLFEFSPGITAIVGPNGSGKSNIVDAIRWILGEQSAKSLRGHEMTDVIFNGSSSRRSLGMAEVTMTFDNGARSITVDADEVRITRRVYRDGEGEYLINQQPARLKDIKDLFLGSGAGADAYCVIEQGRVDVLLQASAQDRRVIFEEAAGISRFKAKKIEAQRKLERVDQNLQRLRDIIDEVEKQLRSVRLQAAKAQRYQEYHDRLKQLRVGLSLREFHELAEQLRAETAILEQLRADLQRHAAQAETAETELRRLEQTLLQVEETLHTHENARIEARQRIAAEEATLAHERDLSANLEADLGRTRQQAAEQAARIAALAESAAIADKELASVEARCAEARTAVQALDQQQAELATRLAELNDQVRTDKTEHFEQMRQAARLHNDAVSYKSRMDNLDRERHRLCQRGEQAAGQLTSLDADLHDLTAADETLQTNLTVARQKLADQRAASDRLRLTGDDKAALLADLRARRSGLASRIDVLEDLERNHEGLGAGVREVIALLNADACGGTAEDAACGFARNVLGLVADLITVPREHAPLIELALGEAARCFVVRDAALLDAALAQMPNALSSRVSFLPLQSEARSDGPDSPIDLPCMPGSATAVRTDPRVLTAADRLVSCTDPELSDLPRQLLGHILLVADLAAARALAASAPGYRFLTPQGDLLDADGTLTIGMHHAEAGLLSRRSELRELRGQATELDRQIAAVDEELTVLRQQAGAANTCAEALQRDIELLAEQGADLRSRLVQHRQRHEGLHQEVALSRSEIVTLDNDLNELRRSWNDACTQADVAEQRVRHLETRLQQADRDRGRLEENRRQLQRDGTTASVAMAQTEERLAAERAKRRQIQADLEQRTDEQAKTKAQLTTLLMRLRDSQLTMLAASGMLAVAYLAKESAERGATAVGEERFQLQTCRGQLSEHIQSSRAVWRDKQDKAHRHELTISELGHRRRQLTEPLRDDYQVELAKLYEEEVSSGKREVSGGESPATDYTLPDAPTEANEAIAELRRKLTRLGSVNLEALRELADLEERAKTLQAQFDDLTGAQRSLEEIITKINGDSRTLFSETFTAIRGHFQELFRKLFGGGMADILLEDESDILETGIDIVARPPGKEQGTLSLMSGGEKTMTAVALLLAIFRSKPSPFCILDEVDAALDESNIGRFTAVLREFLDRSQFILITHSKRTMSAADVLYGVTMQESGVSQRVAMRFEDWPDDGASDSASPLLLRKAA